MDHENCRSEITRKVVPPQPALADMPKTECACETCTGGCSRTPGWFLPGEAEATAKLLGITLQELFDRFLAVDYWVDCEDGDVLVLTPAKSGLAVGKVVNYLWGFVAGTCVFFENGGCKIHAAKPFECSRTTHDAQHNFRNLIADAWRAPEHQSSIKSLLKEE